MGPPLPAVETWSPNYCTTREVLNFLTKSRRKEEEERGGKKEEKQENEGDGQRKRKKPGASWLARHTQPRSHSNSNANLRKSMTWTG